MILVQKNKRLVKNIDVKSLTIFIKITKNKHNSYLILKSEH